MLVQPVIIVEPIAGFPRNFSLDVDPMFRHFHGSILVPLADQSSTTYSGVVAKRAQIFRRVELTEGAVAHFPH